MVVPRTDFPILNREIHGKKLVYLDNAATTQKPKVVIDAMNDYYENYNSNVHRAVHLMAGEATDSYESCRTTLKNWFNAERAIFTSGTTEAINLAAHAWGKENLSSGDVVLMTEMEHHSDIVPWQLLADDLDIELRYIPVKEDFTLDLEAFDASLDGVKLVCIVHTSNVLGVRNPIEYVIEKSHSIGAKVLIDAAQGVPHKQIDFEKSGADFMAMSAHKMMGPTGIGALLVTEEIFQSMRPFMGGGDMIQTVTLNGSTYQDNEHKFEAGTPKIAEAIGWKAAFDYMANIDLEAEHSRLVEIAKWTSSQLEDLGATIYGRYSEQDAAVVSFLFDNLHPEDLAHYLDAMGFAIRTGHHCAQPLLERLGVKGTARASFYLYNTMEEAIEFIDAVKYVLEKFG